MTLTCRALVPAVDQWLSFYAAVGFGSVDLSYLPVGDALTGTAACQPPVSISVDVLSLEATCEGCGAASSDFALRQTRRQREIDHDLTLHGFPLGQIVPPRRMRLD